MHNREHSNPHSLKQNLATVRVLLPYLWPKDSFNLRARVVIALVFLVASKLINVVVPIFYKQAVDALGSGPEAGIATVVVVPVMILLAYGVARILAQAFGELRDAIFTRVAQRAVRLAGLKTFRHLHQLSLSFHLARKTGRVSRAIERGTKGIEFMLRFTLFNILPTLLEIGLVCGILWQMYSAWFAIATFATIVGYIAWTLVVTEMRIKHRRDMNESDSNAHSKAIDSLLNFETVKYFSNEEHESERFNTALKVYEKAATRSGESLSYLNIGQGVIIAIGLTLVMLMAAGGVADGSMTIGDFVLVNAYLIQLYLPLNFLGFVYREIKQSLVDMEQMFSLLDRNPDIADQDGAKPLAISGGAIEFRDVRFSYDPRREILKGISFDVPAGKTVAIVGPSGSGKSTISRLIYRFYDVDDGAILIDGQDVRDVTQTSVRQSLGMVPQDTVLFNDTVFYNIAYARPGASPSEIEQAARHAHIHDFIMALPDGYQSLVGERGLKLSGGEKQRVAIARTILKNPNILIFDEATSALDSHTEREIQASLKELSANRSTVVIAHRLSTVVDADEIIVLESGTIRERGTHQDLLAKNGAYAAMWNRQQETAKAQEILEHADDTGGEFRNPEGTPEVS
ncbi:MAG: ABC transporter ATP-binding protein/permease [Rhodospirillales bacterium]|jgi:ATP-binding cassette, subfamily B, heavy metal transporter|nr:ABC transporter ATP-binding protein/permease [Rhodospirillales bacterium]MBT4038467.1 ABC transporter ATP-binding protein/permease [Rhodospirillales bacterium]MBT4625678.1 ABC transporter ATP-binding protein/permease [Rhodospirillales bacterium]MBT5351860.1 ABC transporter ATP-binding protein/permease [Rhodospirillales bacterium]MBT5520987.1 ABC transporter ATP-binding protein/permease [Rhodospirillales bacterium]